MIAEPSLTLNLMERLLFWFRSTETGFPHDFFWEGVGGRRSSAI